MLMLSSEPLSSPADPEGSDFFFLTTFLGLEGVVAATFFSTDDLSGDVADDTLWDAALK